LLREVLRETKKGLLLRSSLRSNVLRSRFCCHLLCHLLDCHLALVEFDFRFMVEKMVESEVLFFTQSNTTNAFKLLFDSLLLHRTKKTVLFVHFAA
jgi:hypothetical protein